MGRQEDRQKGESKPSGTDYGTSASKASYALTRIRTDIVAGTLRPGQKLSLNVLTAAYQVGMSPLREALCQLMGNGLVVLESQRGFHVAPVSPQNLADIVAVRRHIEVYALGLAIDLAGEKWRQQLRLATDDFSRVAAKAGDQRPINEDWQEVHRKYHFALLGACNSPTLLGFCEQIYDQFDRYRRLAIPVQSFQAGPARDHRHITEAALAGEREEAQGLLTRHIDDIAEVVLANFVPDRYIQATSAPSTRTAPAAPARSRRAHA